MIEKGAQTIRRIAVLIGSDSDLRQCFRGLHVLEEAVHNEQTQVVGVFTCSIHRNTREVLGIVERLAPETDVLIVGAGWANHLTGVVDAYLRYTLRYQSPAVFGVAFEDFADRRHTETAVASITHVPGTQVVFNDYVGAAGFQRACHDAVHRDLAPATVDQVKPALAQVKPVVKRTLADAVAIAWDLAKGR